MDNNIIEVIVSYPTVEAEITYPTLELSTDKVVNFTDNSVRNSWGEITGDINNQADLNLALNNIDSNIAAAVALLNDAINLKEALANKGVAGGYASLNAQGKVPQSQLDIASQVNADWDSISGVSRILNKPIIPSVSGLLIGSNNLSDLGDVATARSNLKLDNLVNVDNTNPANITQTSIYRFTTDTEKATWDAKQAVLGYVPQNLAEKNIPGGYAGVDGSGFIPSSLLPAYVDDVLEFANLAAFPTVGETGKIYVTLNTNKTYRWSGSAYIEIASSPGSTDSVSEGSTNLYFTENRVRNTVLTGLSFAVNSAIIAGDNILQALGKLQAQITARLIAANNLSDLTNIIEARNNLGLGTLSIQSGTFSGNSSGTNTGDETTGTIQSKLGVANTSNSGYLTSTDWNAFNGKQNVLTNPVTGMGASGQITYFNGVNSITSSSEFTFTPTSQLLVNNRVTAASAIARGTNLTPVLTAGANSDVLVGLDINPTFNNGSFSSVSNFATRITGNTRQIGKQEYYTIGGNLGRLSTEIYQDVDIANTNSGALYIVPLTSGGRIYFGRAPNLALLNFAGVIGIENVPQISINGALQWQGSSFGLNRVSDDMIYYSGTSVSGRGAHRFFTNSTNSGYTAPDEVFTIANTGSVSLRVCTEAAIPLVVQGAASQTANLQEWQNSTRIPLSSVKADGSYQPARLADSAATNNSMYYSTTQSKLVYKDSSGIVNLLY